MTDILSNLRSHIPDGSYALDELTGTQAYEWALNDVCDLLGTHEVKMIVADALARRRFDLKYEELDWFGQLECRVEAKAVLSALRGKI